MYLRRDSKKLPDDGVNALSGWGDPISEAPSGSAISN